MRGLESRALSARLGGLQHPCAVPQQFFQVASNDAGHNRQLYLLIFMHGDIAKAHHILQGGSLVFVQFACLYQKCENVP